MAQGKTLMSETIIIAIITAVVSISGSMAATYMQSRKWREGELPTSQANAAGEITDTSLALILPLREEIKSMRSELAAVREENHMMREKLVELEDVREWAERLVHQVQSLGGDPVKMRIRNVVPKSTGVN